jgi:hypothetical protein
MVLPSDLCTDLLKGFVDDWGDNWHDISQKELEKLEVEGLLERLINTLV